MFTLIKILKKKTAKIPTDQVTTGSLLSQHHALAAMIRILTAELQGYPERDTEKLTVNLFNISFSRIYMKKV